MLLDTTVVGPGTYSPTESPLALSSTVPSTVDGPYQLLVTTGHLAQALSSTLQPPPQDSLPIPSFQEGRRASDMDTGTLTQGMDDHFKIKAQIKYDGWKKENLLMYTVIGSCLTHWRHLLCFNHL